MVCVPSILNNCALWIIKKWEKGIFATVLPTKDETLMITSNALFNNLGAELRLMPWVKFF